MHPWGRIEQTWSYVDYINSIFRTFMFSVLDRNAWGHGALWKAKKLHMHKRRSHEIIESGTGRLVVVPFSGCHLTLCSWLQGMPRDYYII